MSNQAIGRLVLKKLVPSSYWWLVGSKGNYYSGLYRDYIPLFPTRTEEPVSFAPGQGVACRVHPISFATSCFSSRKDKSGSTRSLADTARERIVRKKNRAIITNHECGGERVSSYPVGYNRIPTSEIHQPASAIHATGPANPSSPEPPKA